MTDSNYTLKNWPWHLHICVPMENDPYEELVKITPNPTQNLDREISISKRSYEALKKVVIHIEELNKKEFKDRLYTPYTKKRIKEAQFPNITAPEKLQMKEDELKYYPFLLKAPFIDIGVPTDLIGELSIRLAEYVKNSKEKEILLNMTWFFHIVERDSISNMEISEKEWNESSINFPLAHSTYPLVLFGYNTTIPISHKRVKIAHQKEMLESTNVENEDNEKEPDKNSN